MKKGYSQFNEDEILFKFLNKKLRGFCVEVGSHDGVHDSNTLFFEKLGWDCILVEPNPFLVINRKCRICKCAASNKVGTAILSVVSGDSFANGLSTITHDFKVIDKHGFTTTPILVNTETLDNMLAGYSGEIDFITIDVEGHEKEVLEGFDIKKWQPKIIIIEDNSNKIDHSIENYMKQFDYRKFLRTGVNDWYSMNVNLTSLQGRIKAKYVAEKIRIKNKYFMSGN
jgi:FkbM family methyltransferase